jgi:hypothetical protein
MLENPFPTDVRLVLKGDKQAAAAAAPRGRSVLLRAMELAAQTRGGFSSVSMPFPDGSVITAQIFGANKIVTVTAPPTTTEEQPQIGIPLFNTPAPIEVGVGLWSGWIRGPTFIPAGTPPKTYLHDFRPIPQTALAYHLTDGFSSYTRLAQQNSGPIISGGTDRIRPSLYSGAMKRVVQAMLGIGHVGGQNEMLDNSPRYIDGSIPHMKRDVLVTYSWTLGTTHGIYKAGYKNHWLIEISQDRGVLAMPLILMPDTKTLDYYISKTKIGDIGTTRVLDEFGGIPTGESFPTDSVALTNAINAGKVLRLLGASDMQAFYTAKNFYSNFGWAFSNTGTEAHHCCMSDRDSGFNFYPGTGDKYLCGEHWSIKITLSEYNLKNLQGPTPTPVGSGSASLSMIHIGRMAYQALGAFLIPYDNVGMRLTYPTLYLNGGPGNPYKYIGQPGVGGLGDPPPDTSHWGAVVNVFFDGDRMERLKWVPEVKLNSGFKHYPVGSAIGQFCTIDCSGNVAFQDTVFTRVETASRWSPTGFAGDSVDMRTINRLDQRDPNGDPSGECPYIFLFSDLGCVGPIPGDALSDNSEGGDPNLFDEGMNGHTITSVYYGVLPAYCRESYIIVESFQDLFSLTTFDYAAGLPYMPFEFPYSTSESNIHYRKTAAGFVSEVGRVNFSQIEDFISPLKTWNSRSIPPGLPADQRMDPIETALTGADILWALTRDAGPSTQFVAHDGYAFLSDTSIEYIRVGLPTGLSDRATPSKTNWIGTV